MANEEYRIIIIVFSLNTPTKTKSITEERQKQVPFSMAIENVELVHQCSHEHLRMDTVKLK